MWSEKYMFINKIDKEMLRWSPLCGATISIKSIYLSILYFNFILRWRKQNILWSVNLVNVNDKRLKRFWNIVKTWKALPCNCSKKYYLIAISLDLCINSDIHCNLKIETNYIQSLYLFQNSDFIQSLLFWRLLWTKLLSSLSR